MVKRKAGLLPILWDVKYLPDPQFSIRMIRVNMGALFLFYIEESIELASRVLKHLDPIYRGQELKSKSEMYFRNVNGKGIQPRPMVNVH